MKAQNDRVYAATVNDILEVIRTAPRFQKPGSVIICGSCILGLIFFGSAAKISIADNKEANLGGHLKAGAQRVFGQSQWTFQEDPARTQ